MKLVAACVVAVTSLVTASALAQPHAAKPIVTVVRHGGLCVTGMECRSMLRITERTISADHYVARRLKPSERAALLGAIRAIDLAAVRSHPFTDTCPIAYDGTESVYRFRGVAPPLASCTYDLRRVRAVNLTERLFATLKPRRQR
jgi:hypothetical protein